MTAIFLVQLLFMPLAQTPADAAIVLEGRPVARVESSEDAAKHGALSAAERDRLKVVIVRKGSRYFWASRENRELERRVSGPFHYFVDRTEGGYVRIFDRSTLPESMRPEGARFEYTEHVPVWRGTVTLFGAVDRFEE
jgi:hypothetical protein